MNKVFLKNSAKMFLGALGIFVLMGCNAKPDLTSDKIKELDGRVAGLEQTLEGTRSNFDRVLTSDRESAQSLELMRSALVNMVAQNEELRGRVVQYLDSLTNEPPKPQRKLSKFIQPEEMIVSKSVSMESPINVVPPDVVASIAVRARGRWPDNFKMQAYEIETQTEAYLKLHSR